MYILHIFFIHYCAPNSFKIRVSSSVEANMAEKKNQFDKGEINEDVDKMIEYWRLQIMTFCLTEILS
jgi:hypothetical protein